MYMLLILNVGYHLARSLSLETNMWFVCGCMKCKRCADVDVIDHNFSLVAQGRIASCPGDNYNGDEIP